MTNTRLEKEIWVTTSNEVGTLAKLTAPLSEAKVNVWAMCAYGEGNTGTFMFITDNYDKTTDLLAKAGYTTTTKDVVVTELEDKPGTTWNTAQTLATAGININYYYVTTSGTNNTTRVIFNTDNNEKALTLLG